MVSVAHQESFFLARSGKNFCSRYDTLTNLLKWLPILCLLAVFGCATDEIVDKSPDAADAADAHHREDSGDAKQQDSGQDTAEPADTDEADLEETPEDPCGVCCPGEISCVDGDTLGTCLPDGSGYEEASCGEEELCEDAACVARPVCNEGETACHDGKTRMVCRAGGAGWRTDDCADGMSCVGGECLAGEPTGHACEAADDCAGAKCHCGSDESCDLPDESSLSGYCSATCAPGSCGSDEVCVSATHWPAAREDHCLASCSGGCSHLPGMTCASVPTMDSGELTFEEACVPQGIVDIGERCERSETCSGGTCLLDYIEVGLCTTECAGNCPEGTACVELRDNTYYCSPICGNGDPAGSSPCPLAGGEDMMSIQCAVKNQYGGGAKRVCASTR